MATTSYRDRAIQHASQIEQTPPNCFLGAYITAGWATENHVDHCYIVWSAMAVMSGNIKLKTLAMDHSVWTVVRAVLAAHKHITGAKFDVGLSKVATTRCYNVMLPIMAAGRSFSYAVATHPELQSWEIQRGLISIVVSPKEERE